MYILDVPNRNTLDLVWFIYWFGFITISLYVVTWVCIVTGYELYILLLSMRHLVEIIDAKNTSDSNTCDTRSKFVGFHEIYDK